MRLLAGGPEVTNSKYKHFNYWFMNISGFATIDYVIVVFYIVVLIFLGLFLSRTKKGQEKTANDYFLAGNTLTWWAVGASLIAANISAEQFIGMSGSGYRIGLSIAAYELMAAAALIIVAKFLLPIMIDRKIYTIPQFLRERYNGGVGLAFSIFWLFLYVFVNLTSVSWLGALALEEILGLTGMSVSIVGIDVSVRMLIVLILFVIAGVYSIYGGLASVAWTDVLQVFFLVGGGLVTAFFALDFVSGSDGGVGRGFMILYDTLKELPADSHFNLVVDRSVSPDSYMDLPGLAVLVGGLWLTNLGYWGFNQYIIQKGLAAKSINEAKKGLVFAAFLKILIPFVVVIPGICAYVIINHPQAIPGLMEGNLHLPDSSSFIADQAYPWLIRNFTPIGIKGLTFAALLAAIVSSLASMFNSTATIFTMDIYKQHINKDAADKKLVHIGRWVAFISLVIALIAVRPLLGGLDQAFQYIQEYSGFIYPGILVVFGLGLLWKRASGSAAVWTSIATIPAGVFFKVAFPDMPFQFRMGFVFLVLLGMFIALTYTDKKARATALPSEKDIKVMLKWSNIAAIVGVITLIASFVVLFGGDSTPTFEYLNNLGFPSAFLCFTGFMIYIAVFLRSNAKDTVEDPKRVAVDLNLFRTDIGFGLGSLGIIAILAFLYTIFW